MRVFDVAAGRFGVQFDRCGGRHTFLWCAGPLGFLEGSALDVLPEAQCGATVLVPGEADREVVAALRQLGWVGGEGGKEWRCARHA